MLFIEELVIGTTLPEVFVSRGTLGVLVATRHMGGEVFAVDCTTCSGQHLLFSEVAATGSHESVEGCLV